MLEAVPEVVDDGKTGFILLDESVHSLAEYMELGIQESHYMKDACLKRAIDFSDETIFDDIIGIYKKIIDSLGPKYGNGVFFSKEPSEFQFFLNKIRKEERKGSMPNLMQNWKNSSDTLIQTIIEIKKRIR